MVWYLVKHRDNFTFTSYYFMLPDPYFSGCKMHNVFGSSKGLLTLNMVTHGLYSGTSGSPDVCLLYILTD